MVEKQSSIVVEIDAVNAGSSVERIIYIRAHNVGDRNFAIKVTYEIFV